MLPLITSNSFSAPLAITQHHQHACTSAYCLLGSCKCCTYVRLQQEYFMTGVASLSVSLLCSQPQQSASSLGELQLTGN